MDEKRGCYLEKLLELKATDRKGSGLLTCRCGTGRAIWRCSDCADKSAVCLFCCRQRHKLHWFHRVEKWNGRFYQRGSLWQVGVKIFVGHDGSPCPRSISALSEGNLHNEASDHSLGIDVTEVAQMLGKTKDEVLTGVSEVLDSPLETLSKQKERLLEALCEKTGDTIIQLLQRVKTSGMKSLEEEAEALQATSDKASAEAETLQDGPSHMPIVTDSSGDDDWEDVDSPQQDHHPRFFPRPPPTDGAGNPFVTVVHNNGFHVLPIVWCKCTEQDDNGRELQLLDLHLYPASFLNIKTLFTFSCLDDHRYDYLECKSSHYQYHNKLRRLTCPEYPDAAPNRYAELCRVSRQWRNLKHRKWFWQFGTKVERGQMAVFCAACPQPDVNLPANWRDDYIHNP